MKQIQLPNANFAISTLSLGCMTLGTDEKNVERILHTAINHGITYFDTADIYNFGLNEQLIGKHLKTHRSTIHIGTKGGNMPNEDCSSWTWNATKEYLSEAVKNSLRRLQTDYIDLYQLHGGTTEDNSDEIIDLFEDLKKQGYIRAYGISSIRPNVIAQWVNKAALSTVMVDYSLANRRPEEQIFPLLEQNNIRSLYRGTFAKGILLKENKIIDSHPTLKYRSKEEICLLFNLRQTSSASCVVGVSKVEQLERSIQAMNATPLTIEEYTFLLDHFEKNVYENHRI